MVTSEQQVSGSTPSPGADEQLLTTLMLYNDPSNSDPLPSYRDIPPTPQLLGNVKERYVRPNDEPEADMDEDDVRTRRYW